MIIPGILESSVSAIQEKVNRLKGLVDRVHIDVIDGMFADNVTPDAVDLLDVDFGELAVDLHLMVEEPINIIDDAVALRERVSSLRLIVQIERMSNRHEFVREARKARCDVGFALDLYTPISSIEPELLEQLDCILVMSVKTGFSGRHFQHSILEKIQDVRKAGFGGDLIMDGGEDPVHIQMSKRAGATSFAVTSFVWEHTDIREALEQLKQAEEGKYSKLHSPSTNDETVE